MSRVAWLGIAARDCGFEGVDTAATPCVLSGRPVLQTSDEWLMLQVDKHGLVVELGVPYRDLRMLDPLVSCPLAKDCLHPNNS